MSAQSTIRPLLRRPRFDAPEIPLEELQAALRRPVSAQHAAALRAFGVAPGLARLEKLQQSQFFLIENKGLAGERWRCSECHGQHSYFTLRCVERPFDGLSSGLYAYFKTLERSGYQSAGMTGALRQVQELASSHPRTARDIAPKQGSGIFAQALGLAVGISATKAALLQSVINGRGTKPPLRLPGLERARFGSAHA